MIHHQYFSACSSPSSPLDVLTTALNQIGKQRFLGSENLPFSTYVTDCHTCVRNRLFPLPKNMAGT